MSSSPPRGFEDRLKAALLARLPEAPPPAPARSLVRRHGVPLAVGVVTAAVVVVMALPGSGRDGSRPSDGAPAGRPSASATAVPESPEGPGTTLEIPRHPTDDELPDLIRRAKAVGVDIAVTVTKPPGQCSHPGGGWKGPPADPAASLAGSDGTTLRVNTKSVPPGYTLVFMRRADASGPYPGAKLKETAKVTPCEIDPAWEPSSPPS